LLIFFSGFDFERKSSSNSKESLNSFIFIQNNTRKISQRRVEDLGPILCPNCSFAVFSLKENYHEETSGRYPVSDETDKPTQLGRNLDYFCSVKVPVARRVF
jgi:hypothetical protein